MKKQKNKFIIFIIIFIVCILWVQIFISLVFQKKDTNSYALLIEWEAQINQRELRKEQKELLHTWDMILTWEESFLIIEWWDGSVSRIWENTSIKIEENFVSDNLLEMRIGIRILSGKMWSKVVSLIGERSYFHTYFYDIEAGVRGTTFNIDLENETVFVEDHKIHIKNDSWESLTIGEDEPFSIKSFSFIDLEEFVKKIQDIDWKNLNEKLDNELLLKLKDDFYAYLEKQKKFYNISSFFSKEQSFLSELEKWQELETLQKELENLSDKQKEALYKKLYSQYQRLHISTAEEADLYKKKMDYKSILMILSESEETKKALISSTLFDIQDMKKWVNKEAFKESLDFLLENKEILQSMNIKLLDFVDIFSLPDALKEVFQEKVSSLQSLFRDGVDFKDFSLDGVWDKIKSINTKAQDTIHKWLDNIYNILTPE